MPTPQTKPLYITSEYTDKKGNAQTMNISCDEYISSIVSGGGTLFDTLVSIAGNILSTGVSNGIISLRNGVVIELAPSGNGEINLDIISTNTDIIAGLERYNNFPQTSS
jgi:hypothetical protein